jgi:hypothetical protein
VAATLTSLAAGRVSVALGNVVLVAAPFVLAGVGIGYMETAEHAAVASLTPEQYRGSVFGLLAAIQSFGNLAASGVAGLLWTVLSPQVAFVYLAAWMGIALAGFLGFFGLGGDRQATDLS